MGRPLFTLLLCEKRGFVPSLYRTGLIAPSAATSSFDGVRGPATPERRNPSWAVITVSTSGIKGPGGSLIEDERSQGQVLRPKEWELPPLAAGGVEFLL